MWNEVPSRDLLLTQPWYRIGDISSVRTSLDWNISSNNPTVKMIPLRALSVARPAFRATMIARRGISQEGRSSGGSPPSVQPPPKSDPSEPPSSRAGDSNIEMREGAATSMVQHSPPDYGGPIDSATS